MIFSEEKIDSYKQQILDLLTLRNSIFQNLIEGYASNQLYQKDIENFIVKVEKIEKSIKKTHKEFPENVHYLKFLIMIRSIMLNDPIECSKYEKILQENLVMDRQKDYDKVTSYCVMAGECITMIVAYRNYQAVIKKYSQRTPQFFEYAKEEFSTIKSINDLMPEVIGNVHDQIIKVMAKGQEPKVMNSYRMQFIQTNRGFVSSIKLYYSFYFDHSINELLFSGFMLKLRNSYEYIILNKGGWITGISEGFYYFLQDTLGYDKLQIEDLKSSNIYITNFEIDGRNQNNNTIQSYRLCIPHGNEIQFLPIILLTYLLLYQPMWLSLLLFVYVIDFCGMLKNFIKMKQNSKKRIMMHNPQDENLHKMKEQIFEQYYQQNVKTIDVQVLAKQETIQYESLEDGSISSEKFFILELQGLNISRDSKSSINQSISVALQMGKAKTMKESGKNKGITLLSQLIKQAVVKEDVRKNQRQLDIQRERVDVELDDEEQKAKKRASHMIQAINEQINMFRLENDMLSQNKNLYGQGLNNFDTTDSQSNAPMSKTSLQDKVEQMRQNSMTQSQRMYQSQQKNTAKSKKLNKAVKSSDSNFIGNTIFDQNSESSSHSNNIQPSKVLKDLQNGSTSMQAYINRMSILDQQLKEMKNILNQVHEESYESSQDSDELYEMKKSLQKQVTSKFGYNTQASSKKNQTLKMGMSKDLGQVAQPKKKIKIQKSLSDSIPQDFDESNAPDSHQQIGKLNNFSMKRAFHQEESQIKSAYQEKQYSLNGQVATQKLEKQSQNQNGNKPSYSQALKMIKEKKKQQKLLTQQSQKDQELSLGIISSRNDETTAELSSNEYLQEAALKRIEDESQELNTNKFQKQFTKSKTQHNPKRQNSQEELLNKNDVQSDSQNDDDDEDEDDDDLEESEDGDNIMSMKDINQTFSSCSEHNTARQILGYSDDTNASRQRTFGRNQQHGDINAQNEQQMITTNIKIIHKLSNDPSPPQEIKSFGLFFFLQILSFIVFVVIAISMIYQSIQIFQKSLNVMWFGTEISKPLNIYISYLNSKHLRSIYTLPGYYNTYIDYIAVNGYQDFVSHFKEYFEQQIEFGFLNDFKQQQVSLDKEDTHQMIHYQFLTVNMSITNYLKAFMDTFYLDIKKDSILANDYSGAELMPIIRVEEIFEQFQDNIQSFLQDQKYNTIIFNLILYLCFQIFTLFLFFLIFKGATSIKKKKEKLLKLISHITEKEGQTQISKGKLCLQLIKSQDQEYLFSLFSVQQDTSKEQHEGNHQKGSTQNYRKKNIYLSDRINDQSVGIASSYLILLIMFLVSSIIGATGLLLIYQLLANFDVVIINNSNFQKGINSYYFLNIAQDLIEVDRFSTNLGKNQYFLFNSTERISLINFYQDELNATLNYFNQDFLKLVEDTNIPTNYYSQLSRIISERGNCNLIDTFTTQEQLLCKQTLDGLTNNGFQNSMINILERIKNRKLESQTDEEVRMLFDNNVYFDENIISFLHFRLVNQLIEIFKSYTDSKLAQLSQYLSVFYIVAGVLNTIFFVVIFIILKIYFLSPFIYLRRGLLLLPLERAAEDTNVLSMIKSSLQIKF